MKLAKQKRHLLLAALGVGFVVGIIYENIITKSQGMTLQLFQPYFLKQYGETAIVTEELLWHIVKIRVMPFVGLSLLGYFRWRKAAALLALAWTGFLGGILNAAAVLQLGMKGILICIAGFFPHFLFYGIAYGILLLCMCAYPENKWNGSKTIITVLMVLVGILTETYLNPYIMKWIIKLI